MFKLNKNNILYDLKNFNTFKGAIYENVVADCLKKTGCDLFFYKKENSTLEFEFFLRDTNSLIPVDVKASDGRAKCLKTLIDNNKIPDIHYGIKLAEKNIGCKDNVYTFPYFLTFLLKRYLSKK